MSRLSMNHTPRGQRPHIAVFGRCNAGKSSLINAICGHTAAIVSPVSGTTTDPVYQAMELLPAGPVVFIDTAGLDDHSVLGSERSRAALSILQKTDMALLVIDPEYGVDMLEQDLMHRLKAAVPHIMLVINKVDRMDGEPVALQQRCDSIVRELGESSELELHAVSSLTHSGIAKLKQAMAVRLAAQEEERFRLVGDLLQPGELAVLVVPIDKAAPKGRLILPQQQVIRDILECDATAVVTKEHELAHTLASLGRRPSLVITDSQVFMKAAADTPLDVPLTSFSILFARAKGHLPQLVKGVRSVGALKEGDRVLVAEACTHHRQCDDIGTVKIPRWLRERSGKKLCIEHASGGELPPSLDSFALIIHCGACMLNRQAMLHRLAAAAAAGVPIVNYGMFIAYVQGVFPRAIEMFPEARLAWDEPVFNPQ